MKSALLAVAAAAAAAALLSAHPAAAGQHIVQWYEGSWACKMDNGFAYTLDLAMREHEDGGVSDDGSVGSSSVGFRLAGRFINTNGGYWRLAFQRPRDPKGIVFRTVVHPSQDPASFAMSYAGPGQMQGQVVRNGLKSVPFEARTVCWRTGR